MLSNYPKLKLVNMKTKLQSGRVYGTFKFTNKPDLSMVWEPSDTHRKQDFMDISNFKNWFFKQLFFELANLIFFILLVSIFY